MALSKIVENSLADSAVSSAKLKDFAAAVDLNGVELVLDADADTSITADTDDRIDFKIANVEHFSFSNSSGDTIIKPMVDAKDIKFQQFDGRTLLDINDGGFVGIENGATGPGAIRIFEDTDNGSNYVGLSVGNVSTSYTLVFPNADGSSGQVMTTNGSGVLSFADASANTPSSADGQALGSASLEWSDLFLADASTIQFGNDQDVVLTHVADTGLLLSGTNVIQFNDASQNIGAPSATVLDINATDEIELNATLVDVNANLDVSGTIVGASTLSATTGTFSGILKTDDATEATSTTDGSLQTDGGLSVVKDIVAGDDIKLLSHSAVLSFGEKRKKKIVHRHDDGLRLQTTKTSDNSPFILSLESGETDIAVDDVIGQIDFAAVDEATGTDAILVAAGIAAVSEGDFSASNNATKLSFRTAASEVASEKMALSSAGNLTVSGTIVPTGAITANAGVNVDNITIDGTEIDLSSGDLTLDVAGRIDLSADDNGEVRLFDGSSQYAQFKDDSDRFRIESMISDADMMFVGNDGGSEVTAGFFDMSAAGVFELTRGAIRLKKLTEEAESNSMMIDSSGATGISIANTAEVEISSHLNMSGMILINDPTQSGQVALFITGAGQMVEVGDTGSTFVVGSSPASGKIGVFLDSNKVHVKNNLGNACTINIQTFRTRTSQ